MHHSLEIIKIQFHYEIYVKINLNRREWKGQTYKSTKQYKRKENCNKLNNAETTSPIVYIQNFTPSPVLFSIVQVWRAHSTVIVFFLT